MQKEQGATTGATGELSAWDYLRVFRKRFWLLLLVTVVVSTVVTVVTVRLPPIYRATSRLLVVHSRPTGLETDDVMITRPQQWFETQIQIMSSRSLVENAANRLGYKNLPEFADGKDKDAIATLQRRLIVTGGGGDLVDVSAEGEDRQFVKDFVNALVDEYMRLNQSLVREASRRRLGELNNQIEALRDELEAKAKIIAQFKRENNLGLIDQQMRIAFERLEALTRAATQARLYRLTAETEYNGVRRLNKLSPVEVPDADAGGDTETLSKALELLGQRTKGGVTAEEDGVTTPKATASAPAQEEPFTMLTLREDMGQLRREILEIGVRLEDYRTKWTPLKYESEPIVLQLKEQLSAKQDELERKLGLLGAQDAESQLRLAESMFERGLSHEAKLVRDLGRQTVVVRDLNEKMNMLELHVKEEDNLRRMLDYLTDRAKRLNISVGSIADDITVISPAGLPLKPVKPNRPANIAMGIFLGLFLGGLLCVAVEASDVRLVWTPSDVRSALGQPTIGFVPNAEDEVVGF
ncbi:MAG: Wzz/FepE/Etk N-terminal domain-containing protein, partial [Planctomycetota bacterium]